MTVPATVDGYFQLPDAERILVLEVTRNSSPRKVYYLSDAPYETESTDYPAECVFSPIIGGSGLPELRRSLTDPFQGSASVSNGTVTLVDSVAAMVQPQLALDVGDAISGLASASTLLSAQDFASAEETAIYRRGTLVTAKIAAPRRFYSYDKAVTLMNAQIARTGGDSDGNLTIELTDGTNVLSNAVISVGTAGVLCFGRCRNVTPVLVDPSNLIYAVHDSAIHAILNVYDSGVALSQSQYTVQNGSGTFTLVSQPAGTVTTDVEGGLDQNGNWIQTTQQVVQDLLRRVGSYLPQQYGTLNPGTIGLYLTADTQLGPQLTDLMRGAGAYWLIDRTGVFKAAQYPIPGDNGTVFDETMILGKVSVIDDDRLYKTIRFQYRKNWTKGQALFGASADYAAFSQVDALQGSLTATSYDAELLFADSDLVVTHFDDLGGAQASIARLVKLYSTPRQHLTFSVPYVSTLDLGAPVTVIFNGQSHIGVVIAVGDVFDGQYPIQNLEVLA